MRLTIRSRNLEGKRVMVPIAEDPPLEDWQASDNWARPVVWNATCVNLLHHGIRRGAAGCFLTGPLSVLVERPAEDCMISGLLPLGLDRLNLAYLLLFIQLNV